MPVISVVTACIIPLLFIGVFVFAFFKKVPVYDAFTTGAKGAIPLVVNIFPYLLTVFILTEIFERSGLSALLCNFLSPVLSFVGIPKELCKLLLVKPFSGSGATALFSELLSTYGADSYICRCAAVCYGSSETVFYISAVYFAAVKDKKLTGAILISLFASILSAIVGCLLCRFL